MKRKAGDVVTIRGDLKKDIKYGNLNVVDDMMKLAGKTVTIIGAYKDFYEVQGSGYSWTDEMFYEEITISGLEQIASYLNKGHILIKGDYHYYLKDGKIMFYLDKITNKHKESILDINSFIGGKYTLGPIFKEYEDALKVLKKFNIKIIGG